LNTKLILFIIWRKYLVVMCNYHVLEGPCCKMKTTVSSSSGGTLTQDSPRRPSWAHPRCPCRPSIGPTAGMLAEYIPAPRGSIRKHTTWDDDDDRRRRRGETEERDTSRRAGGRAVLGDPHTISSWFRCVSWGWFWPHSSLTSISTNFWARFSRTRPSLFPLQCFFLYALSSGVRSLGRVH